jgi:hypothetical protein
MSHRPKARATSTSYQRSSIGRIGSRAARRTEADTVSTSPTAIWRFTPPTAWPLQRCGAKPSAGPGCFLEHQLSVLAGQVGETLRLAFEHDSEADNIDVELQRCIEVGDVQLGNQRRGHASRRVHSQAAYDRAVGMTSGDRPPLCPRSCIPRTSLSIMSPTAGSVFDVQYAAMRSSPGRICCARAAAPARWMAMGQS